MKRLTALLLVMCFALLCLIPAPAAFANSSIATQTDIATASPEATAIESPACTTESAAEAPPSPTVESTPAPTESPATPEATDGSASVSPSGEPSQTPATAEPSAELTPEIAAEPTAEPTEGCTVEPSLASTEVPTEKTTAEPTAELSPSPESMSSEAPTAEPTHEPSTTPTEEPPAEPTIEPTFEPTVEPTTDISPEPTAEPTAEPTVEPTAELTAEPTADPTPDLTPEPTATPLPLTLRLSCPARYAFANEEGITLTASFAGGVAPYQLQFMAQDAANTLAVQTATADAENSHSFTYLPTTGGDHILTVTVTDALDNVTAANIVFPVAIHNWEYAGDWVHSVSSAELSGDWRTDLVAVARTQLGYSESTIDFKIDDNGIRRGYTRYGAWYGAAYSEWCSMFVSFCLHFANIPASDVPQEAHCGTWQRAIRSKGAYRTPAADYMPQAGDIVFFSWYEDDEAEHIGIVENVDGTTLYTIEGNSSGSVRRREYSLTDKAIVGYASMTRLMEKAGLLRESAATMAEELPEGALGKGYTLIGSVNMRSRPSTESTRIATIKRTNTGVVLMDYAYAGDELWYKVHHDGVIGYIRSDLLDAVLLVPLSMQVVAQPEPISWTPDMGNISLVFQVRNAQGYRWEQRLSANGTTTWTPISEDNTLTLIPTPEALRCCYRCVAYTTQGETLTSDVITLLAEPYFSWLQTTVVTPDMLQRAFNAGGLDLLVLEDDSLVHVRTGQTIARYRADLGYFVDCSTGLIVAYLDSVTGKLAPVVTQADIY
ncbi:MAG: CHAP domain-containing protein [Clostridia bacterium]|nr:CHAP domain-containing protein [Clostridia bacterium]